MSGLPIQLIKPCRQSLLTLLYKKTEKCGLRHTIYDVSGNKYTGEWQDNKKHGRGTQVWKKNGARYEGEWKRGKRDGVGILSIPNPKSNDYSIKYWGYWKNGKKHGFGTFHYNCSSVYDGEWSEDNRCGWGKMCYDNGDVYEGEWWNDMCHGQGILWCANGNCHEGSWTDGQKNGFGKFFYHKKEQLYEGVWLDGAAKCGTLSDFQINKARRPSKYEIPQLQLADMQAVLREAQSAYIDHEDITAQVVPPRSAPLFEICNRWHPLLGCTTTSRSGPALACCIGATESLPDLVYDMLAASGPDYQNQSWPTSGLPELYYTIITSSGPVLEFRSWRSCG